MRRIVFGLIFSQIALAEVPSVEDGFHFANSLMAGAEGSLQHVDERSWSQGAPFDPRKAKSRCVEGNVASPILDWALRNAAEQKQAHISEAEYFIKRAEKVLSGEDEVLKKTSYEVIKRLESGVPTNFKLHRKASSKKASPSLCPGHYETKKIFWSAQASQYKKEWQRKLAEDSTIESHTVDLKRKKLKHCVVSARWTHKPNTPTCPMASKQVDAESTVWVYDNPELYALFKSPECSLQKLIRIDDDHEELHVICQPQKIPFQKPLPKRPCELVLSSCLNQGQFGCTLWERTYHCYSQSEKAAVSVEAEKFIREEPKSNIIKFISDNEFSHAVASMSVFEEMQRDLKKSDEPDPREIQIFKGKTFTCTKNVADRVLYDCCFACSGMAVDSGLVRCSAEEIQLASLRNQGLCHYVGSYEETFLELWKSRDVHTFCCFDSKVARIVQEQGRPQLKKGWGTAKSPLCQGILVDEISQIAFSQIDFKELQSDCAHVDQDSINARVDNFVDHLKHKLQKGNAYES